MPFSRESFGIHAALSRRKHGGTVSRILLLSLAFVALAPALIAQQAPWWFWLGPVMHSVVWPYLAAQLAARTNHATQAENRHLLIDHVASGMWMAAISFNLLPSMLILSMLCMDSITTGGKRLLVKGLLGHAIGIGLGVLVFGFTWQPQSSMPQILACLPLLLLYPIASGQITWHALDKLQQQRSELLHLSERDSLSGLYNRRIWNEKVQSEFNRFQRTGQTACLALIDFDHFKQVNDSFGHMTGDQVIRDFAQRLQDRLRSIDISGRFGGEEFGVLLPNTDAQDASLLMQRLQTDLMENPLLPRHTITISIGVAPLTNDLLNHAAWIRLADQMLYRAKDRGRNCVVIAGHDHHPTDNNVQRENRIPDAFVEKRVLLGLQMGNIAASLFDPSDRLAWANDPFLHLFDVQTQARTFSDIMRDCHQNQRGPRIDTDNINAWLAAADAKRRSQPHRHFLIDLHDGRLFQANEISFENGWLLVLFSPFDRSNLSDTVVRLLG